MTTVSEADENQSRVHEMPFGTKIEGEHGITFRFFAPAAELVHVQIEDLSQTLPMTGEGSGWHVLTTPEAKVGTLYRFVLPDGSTVPDPASRYQPQDVHGPSEVVDSAAYRWSDGGWKGRPWEEAVLYELHVGTFTAEGTFQSAIHRLDHVAALGVTAIELMCFADFAGNRNWGYDGVLLYAPDSAYGRPEDCKAFIDAAHAHGLMVIVDVVYNHFGPEGNYLPQFFPQVYSERHGETPWGPALNFDGEGSAEVREFILHNAAYWVEEFHADGLRIDASHAMVDDGPVHILDDLKERVQQAAAGRQVHLILENETNIAARLTRDATGNPTAYTAQWNHDITHLLAAVLGKSCADRRENEDNGGETEKLSKAIAKGFVIAEEEKGVLGVERQVPPTAFIAFIQTHDLVGNRIFGERLSPLASVEALRAIAAIYLLLPQIPMLFMGEEWAASTPFPFFCDYHGDLAEAIRKGRCDQLAKLDPAPSADEMKRAPNPQDDGTLRSAQLQWDELQEESHAAWLAWYQQVLDVRRRSVVPLLQGLTGTCGSYKVLGPGTFTATWELAEGTRLHLAANLCSEASSGLPEAQGDVIWMEGTESGGTLGSWAVRWSVETQDKVIHG